MIDGSTSKSPVKVNPDMSNGKYCMELVKRYIGLMPAGIDVKGFCSGVTRFIRREYEACGVNMERLRDNPTERLTASAIIYSVERDEVWMVGDCQCIVGGMYYDNPKPLENVLAGKRSAYLIKALNDGLNVSDVQKEDPGRAYILDELIDSCRLQNIAYPVIDGFEIPSDKVKVIDASGCTGDIILASDGYPFLKKTLSESEKALSAQLSRDPLCFSLYKATKGLMVGNLSFDDRCYIRFTV